MITRRVILGFAMAPLLAFNISAVSIHESDFIPNDTRTHFVSFENLGMFANGPYVESGILVDQINGDPHPDIWTTFFHPEGEHGWYPNGGDNGYTRIATIDGNPFGEFGFLHSVGNLPGVKTTLSWELWNDGVIVESGSISDSRNDSGTFLAFSGIDFDEVLLNDSSIPDFTVRGGARNSLAIDSIETRWTAVPDRGNSLLLLGLAAIPLTFGRLTIRKHPSI